MFDCLWKKRHTVATDFISSNCNLVTVLFGIKFFNLFFSALLAAVSPFRKTTLYSTTSRPTPTTDSQLSFDITASRRRRRVWPITDASVRRSAVRRRKDAFRRSRPRRRSAPSKTTTRTHAGTTPKVATALDPMLSASLKDFAATRRVSQSMTSLFL